MVNKNSEDKNRIYKFSYGNIFKKSFSYFFDIISIFGCVFSIVCLWILIVFFIQNILNEKLSQVLTVILSVISVLMEVVIFAISFLPKKIELTENKIKIIKNCVQKNYIIPRIIDNILYSEIKSCEIYDGPMSLLGWNLSYLLLDGENMVEILLKSGKRYHIPVENSEMFIEDVNKRIDEFNNKNS